MIDRKLNKKAVPITGIWDQNCTKLNCSKLTNKHKIPNGFFQDLGDRILQQRVECGLCDNLAAKSQVT